MHTDIDWSTKGKVTSVKNQGACNSDWAFSTIGVVESFYLIKGTSLDLSEQQLMDCSRPQGNLGCNGGLPSYGLNYIKANGITSESAYPYVAKDQACKSQGGSTKIAGFASYAGCNKLLAQINIAPIAVTVDNTNWALYKSGVFKNCFENRQQAVLLVGVVGGAWKVKNSWGARWGEAGYIRLAPGNTCGICNYPGLVPN